MGHGRGEPAVVSVPASSANLGSGFDTLGLALELRAEIGVAGAPLADRAAWIDERHPAAVAFAMAGGVGPLWVRSPIPAGRGLGFSGAMRVGAVVAAHVQRQGMRSDLDRQALMAIPAELEGHADNAAASMFGGVVAATPGRVVRVPLALEPAVVMWIPADGSTSTDSSRATLPESVTLRDAAFNIGRTAQLVAALAGGDVAALREATEDRLHQAQRLRAVPATAAALAEALGTAAWAAWLSGSGPSVAILCDPADADAVVAALPPGAHTKLLAVAAEGATARPA